MWCATSDALRVRSERTPHLRNLSPPLKFMETQTHTETHMSARHARKGNRRRCRSQEKANNPIARCERNRRRRGELCDTVIWCRLAELLQFADNNHNEATPANPYTSAPLFNQKAAFLRPFEKTKNPKKLLKKAPDFPPVKQSCINFTDFSLVLAAFASGGVPASQQLCAGSFPWLSSCHHISLHLEGPLCSLQAVLHSRLPFDFFLPLLGASSLCGGEKGLSLLGWEWFYMFGLLSCMNWSEGSYVKMSCIVEASGRWSCLLYKC